MTWFEVLMGFREMSPSQVRENITVDGDRLTSLVNRKAFTCGRLETPTLARGVGGRTKLNIRRKA